MKRHAPDPGADLGERIQAYLHLLRWLLAADEQRRVDLAAADAARAIPLPPWLATNTFWANTEVRVTHVPVIELATARTMWVASAGVMHDRVVKTAQPTPWAYAIELTAAQVFRRILESHGVTFESLSSARAVIASPCRLLRVEDEYDEVYHRYEGRQIVACSTPGRRSLPPGTLLVPLDQNAARTAAALLEPTLLYGLYQYPAFRTLVNEDGVLPVYRVTAPEPAP